MAPSLRDAVTMSQAREPECVTILTDLLPPALRYAMDLLSTGPHARLSSTGNDRGFPSTRPTPAVCTRRRE